MQLRVQLSLTRDSDNSYPEAPLTIMGNGEEVMLTLENPGRSVAVNLKELQAALKMFAENA